MRSARAALKLVTLTLWSLVLIPPQVTILAFTKGPAAYVIPRLWHRGACIIFGIRLDVKGTPVRNRQTIYVPNHLSYLDMPVMGSLLDTAFLAKKEVQKWPVFGYFSKLQQCPYVERKRTAIGEAKSDVEKFLARDGNLVFFAEGTSTSGLTVLPFKTSFFALAESGASNLLMQPVSIGLVEVDGKRPSTIEEFNIYAWPLEMETSMPVHLWLFAKTSGARLIVEFHEPIAAGAAPDRKTLAKTCYDSVSKGVAAATGLPAA